MEDYTGNMDKQELSKYVVSRLFGLRLSQPINYQDRGWNSIISSLEEWQPNTLSKEGSIFVHAEKNAFKKDGGFKAKYLNGETLFKLGISGTPSGKAKNQRLSKLIPISKEDEANEIKLYQLAKLNQDQRFTGQFNRLNHDLCFNFYGDLMGFTYEKTLTPPNKETDILHNLRNKQYQLEGLPMFDLSKNSEQYQAFKQQRHLQAVDKIFFEVMIVVPKNQELDAWWQIVPKSGLDEDRFDLMCFTHHRDHDLAKIDHLINHADKSIYYKALILKKMFLSHKRGVDTSIKSCADWVSALTGLE